MISILFTLALLVGCKLDERKFPDPDPDPDPAAEFYFGADLSYVNQIMDFNGQYLDSGEVRNPYRIFSEHGANLARFRLWHNPVWTKELYGDEGTQLYNDLYDVEEAIREAKDQGMEVLLDFHYSDTWADPGTQQIPAAWTQITTLEDLVDSVYNYTFNTLTYLDGKGLMPEFVQIGNEINCGMFISGAPQTFPDCNVCDGNWANMGAVLNGGIEAVRAVSGDSDIETQIILHVADPVNVNWWFENMTSTGGVSDFEVIGFSYYPIWHDDISIPDLGESVAGFGSTFGKKVMIMEVAYPWTTGGADEYNNLFGGDDPISGYPYSQNGQLSIMTAITQQLIGGGGYGIIYWEPAWITSEMKDRWGTGSSWESNTFFDFEGNTIPGIDYMNYDYEF